MTELEELTYEIVRKHLTSGKELGYAWDSLGSYYTLKTGIFSSIRVGKDKVEFTALFTVVPVYGDFTDLWLDAQELATIQGKAVRAKRDSKIIRWLKMMR